MKKLLLGAVIAIALGHAHEIKLNGKTHVAETESTVNQKSNLMNNFISIVEIPTSEFSRAVTFYQDILDINIESMEMEGMKMGLFQNDGQSPFVQLIHGDDYKTSDSGTIVYLNGGTDLQSVVEKIENSGGEIIVPKTAIGSEMGFFAIFLDTEGNKLGLHSPE